MLSVWLVCVGKLKEDFYKRAAEEYEKRLRPFCDLNLVELPEQRLPKNPSPGEVQAALRREAEEIRARLPSSCGVCALCVEGKPCSSEAFSALLSDFPHQGLRHLAFLIGSSYGLDPELKAQARFRLSMSPMTFPHHLARVMLLEQIYRSFQIQSGTPYHK